MMNASLRLGIVENIRQYLDVQFDCAHALEHHAYRRFHNHTRGYQQTLKRCVYALRHHAGAIDTVNLEELVAGEEEPAAVVEDERTAAPTVVSSIYTCPRCKSRNVQSHQRQTRSADEGMTVFCQCLTCEKRWRR